MADTPPVAPPPTTPSPVQFSQTVRPQSFVAPTNLTSMFQSMSPTDTRLDFPVGWNQVSTPPQEIHIHPTSSLSSPVISISAASPDELRRAVKSVKVADCIQPAPLNWSCIKDDEDQDFLIPIMSKMIEIHKSVNDPVREYSVSAFSSPANPRIEDESTNTILYYDLKVFGLQKGITLTDLFHLKNLHIRILEVQYCPLEQSSTRQYQGALVVSVSSVNYERNKEAQRITMMASSSTPVITSSAPPHRETENNKKRRRWSLLGVFGLNGNEEKK
jgi:hypothetical protein